METGSSGSRSLIASPRFVLAVGAALALNLLALVLGSAAGATWEVAAPVSINAAGVAATTVLTMVLGGGVVAFIRRRGRTATIVVQGGLLFAIVTAASPFVVAGDVVTGCALAAMHVITGLAWYSAMRVR